MTWGRHIRTGFLIATIACGSFAADRRAIAGTVVPMSVATMADYSAQVIVAEIGEMTPRWADNPRRIETTVELLNIEYLKGGYDGAPLQRTLVVPGGCIGEKQLRICCAPEFQTGQRWLLFLLPEYKTFPTVGIGQGAFRIVTDQTGAAHVFQHGGLPVSGMNDESWIEYAVQPQAHVHGQASSAASNMRVVDRSKDAAAGLMTFAEFRYAIQPVLDASRDHKLTQPAGRHVPVKLRPVPIRTAAAEESKTGARPMRKPPEAAPIRQRVGSTNEPNAKRAVAPASRENKADAGAAPAPEKSEGGER
ncbi:MAG: hypothetical protein H6818_05595 [Phycisphaerales bacterium]|nr:hypothetical protein [Phycisphaerales bacterium]